MGTEQCAVISKPWVEELNKASIVKHPQDLLNTNKHRYSKLIANGLGEARIRFALVERDGRERRRVAVQIER